MRKRIAMIDRLEPDPSTGCWNWTGRLSKKGYGRMHYRGKEITVARRSMMLFRNIALDDPRHVLHTCDNKRCFNPAHLYMGTNADNVRDRCERGESKSGNTDKKYCKHGHEFTPENTYHLLVRNRPVRRCKTCLKRLARLNYLRHQQARIEYSRLKHAAKRANVSKLSDRPDND
jgi:hypothetical protein